ncbi:universal stress protein [Halopiger aswanensis]|uniref:Nucleotide-binding universal stress UspA family protein n=1 Tax=Halopiger aswanensis TaxID=148449 RepID=A0A419W0F5_9EURY|nr:universal stress protein [Halopiger aswanensis]RKD88956.1 nucleotide-binding universal stress UspA family protein [Halopiger aswanensis]
MYDHILVPTDGRESTEQAIDEAIALARENSATLHTLYVVNSAAIAPGIEFADLEDIGQQAVEYVRDRATDAGVEQVVCEVTHGLRHRAILQYAEEHDIDLIVIGRHRELDHLVYGSVSKLVSDNASVPVLIIE